MHEFESIHNQNKPAVSLTPSMRSSLTRNLRAIGEGALHRAAIEFDHERIAEGRHRVHPDGRWTTRGETRRACDVFIAAPADATKRRPGPSSTYPPEDNGVPTASSDLVSDITCTRCTRQHRQAFSCCCALSRMYRCFRAVLEHIDHSAQWISQMRIFCLRHN